MQEAQSCPQWNEPGRGVLPIIRGGSARKTRLTELLLAMLDILPAFNFVKYPPSPRGGMSLMGAAGKISIVRSHDSG